MSDLSAAAQQALEALEGFAYHGKAAGWPETITALRAALAQEQAGSWQDGVLEGHLRERERWLAQETDLSRCPQCNGPADNGHDRSIPPNPYLCTKCMAEPVQEPVAWRHKGAGHFTVSPLVSKFPEWEPLYTSPPRCPNCASLEAQNNELDRKLAELERERNNT